jgi:hypothetical protein
MNYFVQLPDSNMTLNLAHIMAASWDFVAEPNLDPGYVTTVELSTGLGVYLTARDAQTLWKAMQVYNSRVFPAVHAVNGPASAGTGNGNGKGRK